MQRRWEWGKMLESWRSSRREWQYMYASFWVKLLKLLKWESGVQPKGLDCNPSSRGICMHLFGWNYWNYWNCERKKTAVWLWSRADTIGSTASTITEKYRWLLIIRLRWFFWVICVVARLVLYRFLEHESARIITSIISCLCSNNR